MTAKPKRRGKRICAIWLLALSTDACGARDSLEGVNPGGAGGSTGKSSGGAGGTGSAAGGASGIGGFVNAGSAGVDAGSMAGSAGNTSMCPAGTFSNRADGPCKPWSDCPLGTYVSVQATRTSDRLCTRCPDGKTTTQLSSPTCDQIAVTELAVGGNRTCALFSDGTVKCWGENGYGQLGYGHTKDISDPSSVGAISITMTKGVTVTRLWMGYEHTCVLLSDGALKCWGRNNWGMLGQGNTEDIGDNELPSSVGPVSVTTTSGVTVTAVAGSYLHTCALLSNGTVKCWGLNYKGQLGYGNTNDIGDNELPSAVGPVVFF